MWNKLLRANLAYAAGSALNALALVVVIPLLVRRLSQSDYGAWGMSEVAIVLMTTLVIAGCDVGLMREYWSDTDAERRRTLVGSVLIGLLAWGAVANVAVGALSTGAGALGWITPPKSLPVSMVTFSLLCAGCAFTEAVFSLLLTIYRIREAPLTFVGLSLLRTAALLGLMEVWVTPSQGLLGAFEARLGSTCIGVVCAAVMARREIRLHFDRHAYARSLRYGLPLLPTSLSNYVLLAADRFVLERSAGLAAVASYTFAYKVSGVIDSLVNRPFSLDWAPRRFRIANEPDPERKYAAVFGMYLLAVCFAAIGIWTASPYVYRLLAPPTYWEGQRVVGVLLLSYVIYGVSVPLNVGLMLRDRTAELPRIGFVAACVCMLLNLSLIPRWGLQGAAWATVASYVVWSGAITYRSQRLYPIRYPPIATASILVAAGLAVAGVWALDSWLPGLSAETEPSWRMYGAGFLIKLAWIALLLTASGVALWLTVWRPALASSTPGDEPLRVGSAGARKRQGDVTVDEP